MSLGKQCSQHVELGDLSKRVLEEKDIFAEGHQNNKIIILRKIQIYNIFYKNMLREVEVSESKLNFSEILVKSLPSLKERTINVTAIHLCQNMELKQNIIYQSELQRLHEDRTEKITQWNSLIIQGSTGICEKIPLPLEIKKLLVARCQSVVLQLLSWNRLQAKFDLSPLFADSLLTPSDWTAEGRLDDKKIAERLVQDERIPACQRYKMACFHCLELFIPSLWDQVSTSENVFRGECKLVEIWSKKLDKDERFLDMRYFWKELFLEGVDKGSTSTVFHSWDQAQISDIQAIAALGSMIAQIQRHSIHFNQLSSPEPYMDILCFVLQRLSEEAAFLTFKCILLLTDYNILVWFVHLPYLHTLIPIIKELWNILPVEKYCDLLLALAHNYSDEADNCVRRLGYVDYDYGDLMIEILDKSPDHFKRYLFSDDHETDRNPVQILYIVIRKKTLSYRNIKIFHRIWSHVTFEERRSFLKSEYGELFCCCLARKENLELLDSLLKECLAENEVAMFQNKISKRILNEVAEETLCKRLNRVL